MGKLNVHILGEFREEGKYTGGGGKGKTWVGLAGPLP